MKTKVFQTKGEASKISDEAFLLMRKEGEKFPIGLGFRGLSKYYLQAQTVALPADRQNSGLNPTQRKSFIAALNYRYKQQVEVNTARIYKDNFASYVAAPTTPAPSNPSNAAPTPTQSQLGIEPLTRELANAIIEVATLVRGYLSKDKEAMKLFTSTLMNFK